MKIKEVYIYRDKKLQVEQYEPITIGLGVTASYENTETIPQLTKIVEDKLEIEIMKWKDPQKYLRKVAKGEITNPF